MNTDCYKVKQYYKMSGEWKVNTHKFHAFEMNEKTNTVYFYYNEFDCTSSLTYVGQATVPRYLVKELKEYEDYTYFHTGKGLALLKTNPEFTEDDYGRRSGSAKEYPNTEVCDNQEIDAKWINDKWASYENEYMDSWEARKHYEETKEEE